MPLREISRGRQKHFYLLVKERVVASVSGWLNLVRWSCLRNPIRPATQAP